MFRLHRSDRLAVAVILLAACLGLVFHGGPGNAAPAPEDTAPVATEAPPRPGAGIPPEMDTLRRTAEGR